MDAAEVTSDSPFTFDFIVGFPVTQQGRPSQSVDFGAQYTAWSFLRQRFDEWVAPTQRMTRGQGDWLNLTLYETSIRVNLPVCAGALCHYGLRSKKQTILLNNGFRDAPLGNAVKDFSE